MMTNRPFRFVGIRVAGRWWAAPVVAALGLLAAGCQTPIAGADDQHQPLTLVVSDTWVRGHQTGGEAAARISALRKAVARLRTETGTGWTGRQDDVTGFLGDLGGGSWPGTPAAFMDAYGAALFGVDASVLRLGAPDTETVPHVTTTTATQAVGGVPVLDSRLVFTGRGSSASRDSQRVTGVRGRVFPGLTVGTTPTLDPAQASTIAAESVAGTADGDPALVVVPTGAGILTWEVVVVGATPQAGGRYYVDAHTGDIVQVRPASAGAVPPLPAQPSARLHGVAPDPNSVEVTGQDPLGRDLTAYGLQNGAQVELTDTTTQAWDPATRAGAVQTYDGSTVKNDAQLPGRLITSPSTRLTDAEAMAAQSYSNKIIAYYESLGRNSWDGEGGSLVSSVHYGPESFCNAFFAGYLRQPQMVYGQPCIYQGQRLTKSFVEPDVAAHEVTHGVTQSTAGLLYSGQSGALNESFSDYFGNVIGNLIHGTDSVAIGEDACDGIAPGLMCQQNPDGSESYRYMLNGTTFDDYLRVLTPGKRLDLLVGLKQDYGGVHLNSSIWNNTLWSIRTRLAAIDGQPGNSSPLAQSFDRAVFGALTTRLTPTSSFVDARAAVEQVIVDSALDPVVLRTAREEFDKDKICTGCPTPSELAGDGVTTSSQTQLHPTVSGDRVVWLDLSSGYDFAGYAATTSLGGAAPALATEGNELEVTFAGDAILSLDLQGRVTRTDVSGSTVLDRVQPLATLAAGLAGSDAGAAWLTRGGLVTYADPAGALTRTDLGGQLAGDTITTIAAGGGSVAIGTDQGRVFVWTPGSGDARSVGSMPGSVLSAATYAGQVFAIDDTHHSVLFTADGQQVAVSGSATPFGATMSGPYVVWAEATGRLQSAVVPGGTSPYPDTDLYLLSTATGKIYDLHPAPAQQGFPSLSGARLVWQDATYGGDDIFTAALPEGL